MRRHSPFATTVVIGLGILMMPGPGVSPAIAADLRAGDDIPNPPEDPMPPPPPVLKIIPSGPEYLAPSAQELMENCDSKDFVTCFKEWRPPPPPPPPPPEPTAEDNAKEEEKAKPEEAKPSPPPGIPPGTPRDPAVGGPLVGPPPPSDPAADKATLDALAKALKETGLEGKITLPSSPEDGSVELKFDGKPAAKPAPPAKPPGKRQP